MSSSNLMSVIQSMAERRRIEAGDVSDLRRVMFGDDFQISADEAQALIGLDEVTIDSAPEWRAFYLEAVTDHLVRQQRPAGYMDEAGADWLMAALGGDGRTPGQNGLALLVHILDQANQVPYGLVRFSLDAVKASVLRDGCVKADEVALVRAALYAPSGDGNIAITRNEAEVLFDINDACRGADNDPAWIEFFSKALVASVMTVSGYRGLSREEALRRQVWLETPETLGGFFSRMFTGAAEVWRNPGEAMRDDREVLFVANNIEDEAAYAAAEHIEPQEADWLAARMKRDGVFDEGEQRVVDFLREEAPPLHPEIQAKLDLPKPTSAASKQFGRRGGLA